MGIFLLVLHAFLGTQSSAWAQSVVPGAFGWGMDTRAAYGGSVAPVVYRVTNLNDSGPGSLRAAAEATEPRVVVFEISGTIVLNSDINVRSPYMTLAGQTAPSPGITLRGFSLYVWSHDILIQHIRIRPGDVGDFGGGLGVGGGVYANNGYNIVFDHISSSWTNDEGWFFAKTGINNTNASDANVTFWRSLQAEGLNFSQRYPDSEGKGLLIEYNTKKVAILQNVLASNRNRNPYIKGNTQTYLSNNIIYNWFDGPTMYGDPEALAQWGGVPQGPITSSIVGNVYRSGPNTQSGSVIYSRDLQTGSKLFISDVLIDTDHPTGFLDLFSVMMGEGADPRVSSAPITVPGYVPLPSSQVLSTLLPIVGARPADRDPVDARIISEVANRTGRQISSQSEVGGWPVLAVHTRALSLPANPHADDDGDGYTNLEEFLHAHAAAVEAGSAPPIVVASPTPALESPTILSPSAGAVAPAPSVHLSWSPVPGAASYLIRAADLTDSSARYAQNTYDNGTYMLIDQYSGTSFDLPVVAGHSYRFWIHSATSGFTYDDPSTWTAISSSVNFSAVAPAPTPTPSPSPSPAPAPSPSPAASSATPGWDAPVILSPFENATLSAPSVRISWSPISGAAGYLIRASDLDDPNARYSGNTYDGSTYLYYDGYLSTSIDLPVVAGHSYRFWVHAMAANFAYDDPSTWTSASYVNFSVGATAPAPAPTPTPAPVPTQIVDSTAPSVAITSPADGSLVPSRRDVTIEVSASDDVGVTKVEFYVNGALKCSDSAAPYVCTWRVPKGVGRLYSLKARAFDAAGNSKESSLVTVKSR